MKKTWIKIKRGLLTPEHREKLGVRVWLYMYMLDRADWDKGIIYGWKDRDEADDFGMNWRTLQQQRQQLETDGYITCQQKPRYQNITIHNWTNPREYSGDEYNPISGGTEDYVPTGEDTKNRVPSEGTSQGTSQGISKPSTLPYSSHITYQDGANAPPETTNKLTKNEIRKQLEVYFLSKTRLPAPKIRTDKQKKAAGTLWWSPLREIAENANWNVETAKKIIDKSLMRLSDVTVTDPNSILKTSRAIVAELSQGVEAPVEWK